MKKQKWMLKEWLENTVLVVMAVLGVFLLLAGCSDFLPDYMIIPVCAALVAEYMLYKVIVNYGRPM